MITHNAGLIERRDFIKLLGPGIYFLFSSDSLLIGQQFQRRFRGYPEDFNAYLRIAEDGQVTCYSGKVELGQGVITSLAQMLAEELEVPYASVSMVLGDTKLCPWDPGTNGSRSIKNFGPGMRKCIGITILGLIRLMTWCRSLSSIVGGPPARANSRSTPSRNAIWILLRGLPMSPI